MKPDIIFFGEALPDSFHKTIEVDILSTDLLLCIGSSLTVAPVSMIVKFVRPGVPKILINKSHLEQHPKTFTAELLGDSDEICRDLGYRIARLLPSPDQFLDGFLPTAGSNSDNVVFESATPPTPRICIYRTAIDPNVEIVNDLDTRELEIT